MNKANFSIAVASIFLICYLLLHGFDGPFSALMLMFALSPFVIIWMAIMILKHGVFRGQELKEDEEYGYCDKDKSKLGTWS